MADERIAFYMDEYVPAAISEDLRRRGFDVLTTQATGMLGAPDERHLALAGREGRVLFTPDADFLRMHALGQSHGGIIYAPQQMPSEILLTLPSY